MRDLLPSPSPLFRQLKDHFKRSTAGGEVVFASVSIDKRTGKSKQCGIVQFETPSMAQTAIREMRNHPMDGAKLYVRGDVQESSKRDESRRGRVVGGGREGYESHRNDDGLRRGDKSAVPTGWKRANDKDEEGGGGENWRDLNVDELREVEGIIQKRDEERRRNNFKTSDQMRERLKEDYGVHLDDRLKLWWTDTGRGGVPGAVSDIKGEGRWGSPRPWRQIPTDPASDALVDTGLVMRLLAKRDGARKRKDFKEADALLQRACDSPGGGLGLRVHDESRTWRIWTERPPPKKDGTPPGYDRLTPGEMCIRVVEENEPDKVDEMRAMLAKFPGREWNIFKRLKGRYNIGE
jgi:hypothetical protein